MAETYTSSFADGAAVDAALGKAESAVQPGDLGTAAAAERGRVLPTIRLRYARRD